MTKPAMNTAATESKTQSTQRRDQTHHAVVDVQGTIRRDIDAPLAVLRASMEALSVELGAEDPRGTILDGAVEQIVRLGRSVQALVDYAVPPALHPLDCTLEELVRSCVAQLPEDLARSLYLVFEQRSASATVDGPLLSRCLTHLVCATVGPRDEAVLHASAREDSLEISLLIEPNTAHRATPRETGQPALAQADDLVIALAQREIERMGGALESTLLPSGSTRFVMRLPRVSTEAR
jgi:two-component system sensor histidine kinase HydH